MTSKHQLITIAIDGPVGAGKSTLSDALAQKLGILHLDTGAMYRAVGLYAINKGIELSDENQLTKAIEEGDLAVAVHYVDGKQLTLLNGQDVSLHLRGEAVGNAASAVSRFLPVRNYLVHLQQQLSKEQSLLIDGRDIGTVVLPQAKVKIFLTASPQERAQRRYRQLIQAGKPADYQQIYSDLMARDAQDQGRTHAPLHPADDAVMLDTSGQSFEESLTQMYHIVKQQYDV